MTDESFPNERELVRDELTKLLERWQAKTGKPMPQDILRLSMSKIRKAVELTEAGTHVFVPPETVGSTAVQEESIRSWDHHGES